MNHVMTVTRSGVRNNEWLATDSSGKTFLFLKNQHCMLDVSVSASSVRWFFGKGSSISPEIKIGDVILVWVIDGKVQHWATPDQLEELSLAYTDEHLLSLSDPIQTA